VHRETPGSYLSPLSSSLIPTDFTDRTARRTSTFCSADSMAGPGRWLVETEVHAGTCAFAGVQRRVAALHGREQWRMLYRRCTLDARLKSRRRQDRLGAAFGQIVGSQVVDVRIRGCPTVKASGTTS
jgi:hypothetical protein